MYQFKNQTQFYKGKVRDVYTLNNKLLVMQVSNRISAFDNILPRPIPYKGQVLNQLAFYFLNATKHICKNWCIASPFQNISYGHKCEPIAIEVVVRAYLTGHAARTYFSGKRELCGVALKEGMQLNEKFQEPIITPTTKNNSGHDLDISREEIISSKIVTETIYKEIENIALKLFAKGTEMANDQGLILVDTKYEFGILNNEIVLMDEIHTPDSSRYFIAETYHERMQKGEDQIQLSKEFVRQWLIANNYTGQEGQTMPTMTDEWVETISEKYIELFEKITGTKFQKQVEPSVQEVQDFFDNLKY
jgi:phosphoribosylaminoimidazole-succinocarboxamide synthase